MPISRPIPTVDDGSDGSAIHDDIAGEINAIPSKTPLGADTLIVEDSASGFSKKKVLASHFLGGGGAAAVTDFVTVGSGSEDFSGLGAAWAAGNSNVRVTSSYTESATVTIPNRDLRVVFDGAGITLTFAPGVTIASTTFTSTLRMFINGGTIVYATNSGFTYPFDLSVASHPTVEFYGGGIFTSNSTPTQGTQIVNPYAHQKYFGTYTFNLPSKRKCGIKADSELYIEEMNFVGGGGLCYLAFISLGTTTPPRLFTQYVRKIEFSGTWNTSGGSFTMEAYDPNGITGPYDCLEIETLLISTTSSVKIRLGCIVNRLIHTTNNAISITAIEPIEIRNGEVSSSDIWDFTGNFISRKTRIRCLLRRAGSDPGDAGFYLEDGKWIAQKTTTTDATQTELFFDPSATLRFGIRRYQGALIDVIVYCQRKIPVQGSSPPGDQAVFRLQNLLLSHDGTTATLVGGNASLAPVVSTGTGSTVRLSVTVDNPNKALALKITGNAAEDWDTRASITFLELTNPD